MKRMVAVGLLLLALTGCAKADQALERAMGLRAKLLASDGCRFQAKITADYGEKIQTFRVSCQADTQSNVTFSVIEPETIAGIGGTISGKGGALTFDDQVLAFPLLADDQLAPVSAPWIFLQTLQGGYVRSCGVEGDMIRVTIDDSYEDDALRLDIWLGEDDLPVRGDILYRERRILSLEIEEFQIL